MIIKLKKNSFVIYCILIFFYIFLNFTCIAKESLVKKRQIVNINTENFFQQCHINTNDIKTIKYIITNTNSNYMPSNIEDISNDSFKKALYLYLFYQFKEIHKITNDEINVVGFDYFSKIKKFANITINYMLTNHYSFKEIKNYIEIMNLEKWQIKDLLFNKKFVNLVLNNNNNQEYNNFVLLLISKISNSTILTINDTKKIKQLYSNIVSDEILLQQIRIRLWKHKTNDIDDLISLINNDILKNHAQKLVKFHNHHFLQKLNKNNKKINKAKKTKDSWNCLSMIGYDEYIDLYCVETNFKNKKYIQNILSINNNPTFLPDTWLKYRLLYTRDNLFNKDSYSIISNGNLLEGENYYKQQFLAGLTSFLNQKFELAIKHFTNCVNCSKFAEENSRASYWLALSYNKIGETDKERKFFLKSSNYPFTMYGQLAIDELGENAENIIKEYIINQKENIDVLCNDTLFITAYLHQLGKNNHLSNLFINFADANKNDKEKLFSSLVVMHNEFSTRAGITYARHLKQYNVVIDDLSYPIINRSHDSLVNAIIQKESNFHLEAASNKGAKGVMQIMPSTCKILTKNIGIEYSENKLLYDNDYNIMIGTAYLKQLLKTFNNHKILALSSYNAGILHVRNWIKNNNDPRNFVNNADIVKWIELIPFNQTRNYIIQVLGAEMVYEVIRELYSE